MGATSSRPDKVKNKIGKTTEFIKKINEHANELSSKYRNKFLYPDFCNQVAMIYSDKLSHFRRQELEGASYILGLTPDVPGIKQEICKKIVEHYTRKLNLVQYIQDSLSYCDHRILATTIGPYCKGDPMIFESDKCESEGHEWQTMRELPADDEENDEWFEMVDEMQTRYIDTVKRLFEILDQLLNYDEIVDEEALDVMIREVKMLVEDLNKFCQNQYHKIETTTERLTAGELEVLRRKHQQEEEKRLARIAALRDAYNLPAVPQS